MEVKYQMDLIKIIRHVDTSALATNRVTGEVDCMLQTFPEKNEYGELQESAT